MNVAELAWAVHRILSEAELDHGIGGALALNFYADPRATADVDISVFVPWSEREVVIPLFEPIGYTPVTAPGASMPIAGVRLATPGSRVLLDVFFAVDEHYELVRQRLRWYPFGPNGEDVPFFSAEDIAMFKVSFGRPKDWVDLQRMVQSGPPLDLDYIEDTLVALRGPTMYPRIARLRAMVAAGGELP